MRSLATKATWHQKRAPKSRDPVDRIGVEAIQTIHTPTPIRDVFGNLTRL